LHPEAHHIDAFMCQYFENSEHKMRQRALNRNNGGTIRVLPKNSTVLGFGTKSAFSRPELNF
jgi:hypothetical protein